MAVTKFLNLNEHNKYSPYKGSNKTRFQPLVTAVQDGVSPLLLCAAVLPHAPGGEPWVPETFIVVTLPSALGKAVKISLVNRN